MGFEIGTERLRQGLVLVDLPPKGDRQSEQKLIKPVSWDENREIGVVGGFDFQLGNRQFLRVVAEDVYVPYKVSDGPSETL